MPALLIDYDSDDVFCCTCDHRRVGRGACCQGVPHGSRKNLKWVSAMWQGHSAPPALARHWPPHDL
eukprot:4775631-Amphidinium_carterae.2